MQDEQINALADAIGQYLSWRDCMAKLRIEARKSGFRIAYKRRLHRPPGFDPATGLKKAPEPVFECLQGVLWLGLKEN